MVDSIKALTAYDVASPAPDDLVMGVKGGVARLFPVSDIRTDTVTVRPVADMGWHTPLLANTAVWTGLKIAEDIHLDSVMGAEARMSGGDVYNIKTAGLYVIRGSVTHTHTSAAPIAEARLLQNGATIGHTYHGLTANAYATLSMCAVVSCAVDDEITLETRSGGSAVEGKLVVIWLGPDNS